MEELKPDLSAQSTLVIENRHTAARLGSGDLEVLATPAMIALMENAAMTAAAKALAHTDTTVGTAICVEHLAATLPGKAVTATATLKTVDGRRLTFDVSATDADGHVIGRGTHTRVIVDRQRFIARL